MGLAQKTRNRLMISRGRAKWKIGRLTRNRSMQAAGFGERVRGGARQVVEQARDARRNIRAAAKS